MTNRISIKQGKPCADQDDICHNRWHPNISPAVEISPGDEITMEALGYDDYQLKDNDDLTDVKTMDLSRVHPLTGPVYVKGAQPEDLLVVDILDLDPLSGVGYSCIIPGIGGILKDMFPDAFKSVWYCKGIYAESRHVPGVKIPGIPHPGVIGVAPSKELLKTWNSREAPLVLKGQAYAPNPGTAVPSKPLIAKEAARTVPPRENGGNVDIKNLSIGSRLYFPVFVKGALLSVGDSHFAQGDGEVTWNAIEMDSVVRLKMDLIKGGAKRYGIRTPIFEPGPIEPRFNRFLAFTGISVQDGVNYYVDATVAARQAVISAVTYLKKMGFTGEQAYTILSVSGMEMRISSIVDVPNACVSVFIPRDIFVKKDILPK